MNRQRTWRALALAGAACAWSAARSAPVPLTLRASDGVKIYAQHAWLARPRAVVLLFHQSYSNMHEYDPVMRRLAARGYANLATDQRVGGDLFGGKNRTVAGTRGGSYAEALLDLEAAVAWAERTYPELSIFALGSSYSAMLVFPLAADHPQLAGILAFSPADYSGDGWAQAAAATVRVPIFATSSGNPAEQRNMDALLRRVRHAPVTRFQPSTRGMHAAESLWPDRNIYGTAPEYWQAMLDFLRRNSTPRRC